VGRNGIGKTTFLKFLAAARLVRVWVRVRVRVRGRARVRVGVSCL
jgi:ATPase subunit of ABC transporter with duplicated ATPase domains